jgi:serine protease
MVGCSASGGVAPTAGSAMQQSAAKGVPTGPEWRYEGGVLFHTPHYMATRSAASQAKPQIQLTYYNGPVLVTPTTYYIFWGYKTYGDKDKVKKLLKTYTKNMGGSGHNNIYTQYYEKVGSTTTYITNPTKQLGGIWEDDKTAVPLHPTDAQVAAEAILGVAHFGYNANASYVVATPTGHSSSGFGTSWCAYHDATYSGGNLVSYTNLPYMPDAGGNCGANFTTAPSDESATDEGVTIVEGHEYGESVTDPNPGTGWYNNAYGEIGDICAWQDIQNDPFGKKSYTMQPMFSNATSSCVQTY